MAKKVRTVPINFKFLFVYIYFLNFLFVFSSIYVEVIYRDSLFTTSYTYNSAFLHWESNRDYNHRITIFIKEHQ